MRGRSAGRAFSLWEKVTGEAGRMRVRAAIGPREAGVLRPAPGAGALIRRFAPPSPGGRRGSLLAALGLAVALAGCNPFGYPDCYRVQCPSPPFYHASYAGYVPAYEATYPPRPAFFEPPWDDPFADYTQRIVTISPGAGNTEAANTALQTATPWPRYSNNTNIPGSGPNMVRAVQQYESGTRPAPAAPLSPLGGGGGGGGGGAPTGGGQ